MSTIVGDWNRCIILTSTADDNTVTIFLALPGMLNRRFLRVEDEVDDPLDADLDAEAALCNRKRLVIIVTSMVFLFVTLLDARQKCPGVPLLQKPLPLNFSDSFYTSDNIEEYASSVEILRQNLWA